MPWLLSGKTITVVKESIQKTSNGQFYNCYSWKRGRSGPCFDTTRPALLCKSDYCYAN